MANRLCSAFFFKCTSRQPQFLNYTATITLYLVAAPTIRAIFLRLFFKKSRPRMFLCIFFLLRTSAGGKKLDSFKSNRKPEVAIFFSYCLSYYVDDMQTSKCVDCML